MVHADPPAGGKKDNPNRVRDHLANERTYLAWIRTAVALLGFGVVIVRLRYLLPTNMQGHSHGWELGLAFVLVGLVMVGLSASHYFAVHRSIEEQNYEPTTRVVVLCTAVLFFLGLGVLYYLLTSPLPGPSPSPGATILPS